LSITFFIVSLSFISMEREEPNEISKLF
jgi:hypothetical protein